MESKFFPNHLLTLSRSFFVICPLSLVRTLAAICSTALANMTFMQKSSQTLFLRVAPVASRVWRPNALASLRLGGSIFQVIEEASNRWKARLFNFCKEMCYFNNGVLTNFLLGI